MVSEREKKLERIIEGFLSPAKNIPFELVIRSLYDVDVEKFEIPQHNEILEKIELSIRQTCLNVQENPIRRPRPNEVGNDIEPFVIESLKKNGFHSGRPKTTKGNSKTAGYPDIRIDYQGFLPIYIEVKTYAKDKSHTKFRSFYLSPSDEPKVIETAYHLVVGFEIEKEVMSGGNDDLFRPIAYKIADLYGLDCDLKAEFNSDNIRLYDRSRLLAQGSSPYQGY